MQKEDNDDRHYGTFRYHQLNNWKSLRMINPEKQPKNHLTNHSRDLLSVHHQNTEKNYQDNEVTAENFLIYGFAQKQKS